MDNDSISQFRDKYIAISKLYKMRDSGLRWYVRDAENYIKAHESLSLHEHGPAQLENYLREKGRNPNLESWQFKQMLQTPEILFQEQLGHQDVKTTEIYTHVLKRGARVVRSPLSDLNNA